MDEESKQPRPGSMEFQDDGVVEDRDLQMTEETEE